MYTFQKGAAKTGNLTFLPESVVNEEAERLVKEEGVFTNIVLSHCGYDIDKQIARNASEKISLIVGGHSHTFLYTGGKYFLTFFRQNVIYVNACIK